MKEHHTLSEALPIFITRHLKAFSIFNLTQFSILLLLPLVGAISLALSPINKAHALQNTYVSQADTFVTPSTMWNGNGTDRNGMPIGSYTDYTIGGVLFSRSKGLIHFGQINLPPGAIVQSAYVRVYHYGTNAGDDTVYVARATNGWSEGTVWTGPSFSGNYGSMNFPSYNSDFVAVARDIPVSTTLVNELRNPNDGIVLKNLNNDFSPGIVVCQRNILAGPCAGAGTGGDSNKAPRLIVNYIVNTPPNQPNLDRPQSGWELGPRTNGTFTNITCDSSGTGLGCSVEFRASADDPDDTFPITNTYEINSTQGGSANHTNSMEGWQTWTRALSDGNWRWRGKSVDVYGGDSGWTGYRSFVVDTTAPSVLVMVAEPAFTPGVQNTVSSSIATDNIIGGIQYEFERATDTAFTISTSSSWVDANSFTFASLVDEQIYYYRVRSRDSLHNVSGWSNEISSTQDATLPVIDSLNVSELRISPANQDGVKDSTTVDVSYSDLHLESVRIDVVNASGTVVRTHQESGLSVTTKSSNFTWDGKNTVGSFVADGSYNIKVYVTDKAGNQILNDTNWVIVDNVPADVSIQPADGSWFNGDNLDVNGQTEADATLTITNLTTSQVKNAVLNGVGQYLEDFTLNFGENAFEFLVKDNVGNTNSESVKYYKEVSAPTISNITPNALTNDRTPSISFDINDSGDGAFISGVNANSVYLSLLHPSLPPEGLVLVNNGINIQPALGAISQNCSTQSGTYGNSKAENCTFTYTFTGELQPDGNYQIKADVSDIAGNSGPEAYGSFELDSHIQNDVAAPTTNQLFNYSLITLSGTAEKGATLNISVPNVDATTGSDNESFVLDSSSTAGRVSVANCRATATPSQDGIKEVCDWQVNNFQLERDLMNNVTLQNPITFALTDTAGNTNNKVVNVDVNLYAVSLSITTDIEFFSPNGDGQQDGVDFNGMSTDGQVSEWEIRIDDASGARVKTFSGVSSLPGNVPWDGRDGNGNYVADGEYTYYLWLKTTDGIEFSTTPSTLTAVTSIQNGVIITYPKNNSFTTRGVVNVQGQAPVGTKVRICDDVIGIDQTCNFDYSEIEVDANGSFSVIIPLYRLAGYNITEHFLTATAYDKYGNTTPPSNNVKVSVTNQTPFERVEIIPVYTGVNDSAAYATIQAKLDNNQEVTQADIMALRNVVLRSIVHQGTERVKLGFADHTNLNELPNGMQFQNIGWIDGSATNGGQHFGPNKEFIDGTTPYVACTSTECTWDFYYPIPPMNGGLFEVAFNGKLAEDVQIMTAAFTVDGNIPAAPMILDIDKKEGSTFLNTYLFENKHYSNSSTVLIKGVSDPGADIEVRNSADDQNICTTQANSIGFWNCEAEISSIYPAVNTTATEFVLEVSATLGANTVDSLETKSLVIDKVAPLFDIVSTSNQWHQAGDIADVSFNVNEELSHAIAIEGSSLNCVNDSIVAGVVYDLNLSANRLESTGSFVIDGNAVEGRYCMNLQIVDLAGNKTIRDQEYYIDNTAPDMPDIDTTTWGVYNGINTQPGFISQGRLNPEYVHEEDEVHIYGVGEENQLVELWVDGVKVQEAPALDETSGRCIGDATGNVISDSVLVKSGYLCLFAFEFTFDKGERGYIFQVKSIDKAGNESIISEDELIYYDKTPPLTPETIAVKANGSNIVDWQYAREQAIVAISLGTGNFGKLPITNQKQVEIEDWGEPLSDALYVYLDPKGQLITQNVIQKSGNGIDYRPASMAKGDGVYSFYITTYDAPGNQSSDHIFQVELDTVPPQAPAISLSQDFNAIYMNVAGEPGSFADGALSSQLSRGGTTFGVVKNLSVYRDSDWERTFTFCVRLRDRATNLSGWSCKSITTPVRPPKPGECQQVFEDFKSSSEYQSVIDANKSCLDKTQSVCQSNINDQVANELYNKIDSRSCKTYAKKELLEALQGQVAGESTNATFEQVNKCVEGKINERIQNAYNDGTHADFTYAIHNGENKILNECGSQALGLSDEELRKTYEKYLKDAYDIVQDVSIFELGDVEEPCSGFLNCQVRGLGAAFDVITEGMANSISGNGFQTLDSLNTQMIMDDCNDVDNPNRPSREACDIIIDLAFAKEESKLNLAGEAFLGAPKAMDNAINVFNDPDSSFWDKAGAVVDVGSRIIGSAAIVTAALFATTTLATAIVNVLPTIISTVTTFAQSAITQILATVPGQIMFAALMNPGATIMAISGAIGLYYTIDGLAYCVDPPEDAQSCSTMDVLTILANGVISTISLYLGGKGIYDGYQSLRPTVPTNNTISQPPVSGFGKTDPSAKYDNPYFVRLKPGTNQPIAIDTRNFTSGPVTENGGIRNPQQFWRAWMKDYPDTLSSNNKGLITNGLSPKVDETWIKSFPEHSNYTNETIIHHHLDKGPLAYPLPEPVHRYKPGFGIWHQ